VAVTGIRLYSLSYYPEHIPVDEGWVLSWAVAFARDGRFYDPLAFYGSFDVQRFIALPALWITWFGAGVWQTRLLFFILTMAVIALGMRAARNLFGSAWMAALALFGSAVVMGGARLRHDIGLALAAAVSLWLYSEAVRRERAVVHLLAGVAIGLGWFAHYHAILIGAAMLIGLYAPRWIESRRWIPPRGFWWYALGGLIGAAIVFGVQILPDLDDFVRRQPRSPQSLDSLLSAFVGHVNSIALHSEI
jgi:hypothetical protein